MRKIIQQNLPFFVPYIVFVVVSLLLIFFYGKANIHLVINQFHSSFFDTLFVYTTYVGDGIFVVFFVIFLLFFDIRKGILIGISCSISGMVAQFLKHLVFEGSPRPKLYFDGIYQLYLVPNVEVHAQNSFPSGHTTTAFSTFLTLAMLTDNKILKSVYFGIALLIGYSRMYLSQHFLTDVVTASFIGVVISILVYALLAERSKQLYRLFSRKEKKQL